MSVIGLYGVFIICVKDKLEEYFWERHIESQPSRRGFFWPKYVKSIEKSSFRYERRFHIVVGNALVAPEKVTQVISSTLGDQFSVFKSGHGLALSYWKWYAALCSPIHLSPYSSSSRMSSSCSLSPPGKCHHEPGKPTELGGLMNCPTVLLLNTRTPEMDGVLRAVNPLNNCFLRFPYFCHISY